MSSYYDAGYISEDITNDFLTPIEGIKGKEAVKAYVKWIASMRNITLAIRDSKPHKIREYDTDQDLWRIDVLTGTHNHPFPEFAEGSRLGTLTPNQFKEIQQQERLRISPRNMLADIKRRDPTNVTDIKRVNNAINNIRSQKREGRTPTQNYFHLLQKFDYRYEFRMVDGSNELQDVIFSHPESYAMVNTYPQVLIIDNTYKTTVYDMPLLEAVGATSTNKTFTIAYAFMQRETQEHFEFVLQFIRGLYESVEPNVVLTDRDLALMKAVDKIFPNSQKQLCRRHIEQCVLTRALQQPGFNKEFAECFKHRWNKAIEAATPEEFLHSWEWVKQQYKHYPGLIHYCEETWLSQHIDRVLSAFIDQRLHYGNYTTNRVEQEHHRVKANLDGSNHTFDYVFEQIHQVMELQIVEIKKQSMINVNKTRTDMLNCKLFSNLVRNVTFKAFELIIAEGTRDLGQNTCGCYLWRTHGLPCNCRLLQYMSCGWSIPLDSIDLYWRTLNIEFSCGTTTRRKIFQDTEDISAPPAVEKHKKPTSTDREPSNWEKWCKVVGLKSSKKPKGKGRVAATNAYQDIPPETRHRNSISEGCWTSFPEGSQHRASFSHGPRPPSPDSPPSMPSNSQQVPPRNSMARQSESRVPLRGSKMEQYFPPYIREYIESYTDVVGDGNCGFRVIALAVLGTQDQWRTVREDMLRDLRGRSELYNNVIGGFTTMPALDQIINHFDGPCGPTNYFSVPYCGYVAATTYNVFVMTFGETGGYLCPPVALEPYRELSSVRVVLGHVNNYNHWILLHMRSDYHPVPWLLEYWIKRRDPSAYGLELQFKEQMELYNYLHNNDAKRRQDKREAEKEAKKQARQNQFLFFL